MDRADTAIALDSLPHDWILRFEESKHQNYSVHAAYICGVPHCGSHVQYFAPLCRRQSATLYDLLYSGIATCLGPQDENLCHAHSTPHADLHSKAGPLLSGRLHILIISILHRLFAFSTISCRATKLSFQLGCVQSISYCKWVLLWRYVFSCSPFHAFFCLLYKDAFLTSLLQPMKSRSTHLFSFAPILQYSYLWRKCERIHYQRAFSGSSVEFNLTHGFLESALEYSGTRHSQGRSLFTSQAVLFFGNFSADSLCHVRFDAWIHVVGDLLPSECIARRRDWRL